jgi:hypothetical protein
MTCEHCPFHAEHEKQVKVIQSLTRDKWLLLVLLSWALVPTEAAVGPEQAAEGQMAA